MSAKSVEAKARRGFFLAIAAGVGDAVVNAAGVVARQSADAAPPSTAEITPEPTPPLRRRNAVPTSIPDVRLEDDD